MQIVFINFYFLTVKSCFDYFKTISYYLHSNFIYLINFQGLFAEESLLVNLYSIIFNLHYVFNRLIILALRHQKNDRKQSFLEPTSKGKCNAANEVNMVLSAETRRLYLRRE